MKPALRLLLTLFTILCSTTISGASIQESQAGVAFEKAACVLEAESHFSANFNAPKKTPYTYRGDSRGPQDIFENGFQPRGNNTNLLDYTTNNTPSNFVSTSKSSSVAGDFADNIYVVKPRNGIDVNSTLGPKSPFPNELEIAIPGDVRPSDIRSVTIPKEGMSHLNPNFKH